MTLLYFVGIVLAAIWLGPRMDPRLMAPAAFRANILGALSIAAPVIGGLIGNQAASGDRRRARELSRQSVESAQRGARGATQQFGLGSPMRDAFRHGALNLGGTTAARSNPFSQDLFGGFAQFLQRESGPGGVGTGFEAQEDEGRSRSSIFDPIRDHARREFSDLGGRSGGGRPTMRGASVKRGAPTVGRLLGGLESGPGRFFAN